MTTTKKAIAVVFTATISVFAATSAAARTLDDLTCYKVKAGSTFSHATVDIDAENPAFGDSRGCSVRKKITKVCVPTDVDVEHTTGEQWSGAGLPLENYFICYKTKCASDSAPETVRRDQFGSHELTRPRTTEICVPAVHESGEITEPDEMDGMTAAHNRVRAEAPGATDPLPPVEWDVYMEAGAAAHAAKCQFRHASAADRGGAGENIYMNGTVGNVTPAQVANTWASERYIWDPETGACYGRTCGHYTQMVWRETRRIGCAVNVCGSGDSAWEFWVCRYDPAGNIRGQMPY